MTYSEKEEKKAEIEKDLRVSDYSSALVKSILLIVEKLEDIEWHIKRMVEEKND